MNTRCLPFTLGTGDYSDMSNIACENSLWPVEPFPLFAVEENFQELVGDYEPTEVKFDSEAKEAQVFSLLLKHMCGYLLAYKVNLNIETFKS